MSALLLLSQYSSSSDDESPTEERSVNKSELLRCKLPRPDLSTIKVIPREEHIDDSELHEGRIRSFPHVRGNWASFVYIPYFPKGELKEFCAEVIRATSEVAHFVFCDNPHVSLSRTVTLRYHQIKTFTSALQELLCPIKCVDLYLSGVEVFTNEESTRTFLSLAVDTCGSRDLSKITEKIDAILEEFKCPKFYSKPSYHISLLWCTGDCVNKIKEIHSTLENIFLKHRHSIYHAYVDKIHCKSGNKNFIFPLADC